MMSVCPFFAARWIHVVLLLSAMSSGLDTSNELQRLLKINSSATCNMQTSYSFLQYMKNSIRDARTPQPGEIFLTP